MKEGNVAVPISMVNRMLSCTLFRWSEVPLPVGSMWANDEQVVDLRESTEALWQARSSANPYTTQDRPRIQSAVVRRGGGCCEMTASLGVCCETVTGQ
jgi:hypothetical protein